MRLHRYSACTDSQRTIYERRQRFGIPSEKIDVEEARTRTKTTRKLHNFEDSIEVLR